MSSRHDRTHLDGIALSAAKFRGLSTDCIVSNDWRMLEDYCWHLGPGYMDLSIRRVFLLSRAAAHSWAPSHSLDLGWPTLSSWDSQLAHAITKGHARTVLSVRKEQPLLPWKGPTIVALFGGCIWYSHIIIYAASPSRDAASENSATNSMYLPYKYSKSHDCRQKSTLKSQKTP